MSTIDQLMSGKAPGEIKIALPYRSGWFQPYFKDENKNWHGLSEKDRLEVLPDHLHCTIYQDPKPTKVVYEWMYYDGDEWRLSGTLDTEEWAAKNFETIPHKKTGREFEVEG